jgi:hypothetical protein
MGTVVLNGATSGSTTIQPTDAVTATLTLPSATGTLLGSGNQPAFSVYQSSPQTLSQSVIAKIQFQSEEFDTNNNFDSTTNYRFTPTIAGYYQINAAICFTASAVAQQDAIFIYKNGSNYKIGNYIADTGALGLRAVVSCLVYCNGSTDYIEIYGLYNAGAATMVTNAGSANTWFNGSLVRAA